MFDQPFSKKLAESWENEGGSLSSATEAELLGVTLLLSESYVVGGYSYTKMTDAIAQGRRMQKRAEAL